MRVDAQRAENILKTWLLIGFSLILIIIVGFILSEIYAEPGILYVAVVFSLIANLVSYWFSASLALAMSGAKPVKKDEEPRFCAIVENLAEKAKLPMPKLYKIEREHQINAFATGRGLKSAAIAVTAGALEKLNDQELEGVLAHELSHVKNRDILVSTIVVMLAAIISIASRFFLYGSAFGDRDKNGGGAGVMVATLVVAILAPLIALVIQMAVSRKREYLADASGAKLVGSAEGLASALERMKEDSRQMSSASTATSHLFIANPFKGMEESNWVIKLFMTHPPLKERIRILKELRL